MKNIQITETTKDALEEFEHNTWPKEDLEHYGKQVEWIKKKFAFKATDNDKIIGAITGKYESGVLYIGTLIVDKKYRGKGIGKRLIERAEEFGRKEGAHKFFLFTMENWKAAGFYNKLGYEKTGSLPKHYLKRDFVIYTKFI